MNSCTYIWFHSYPKNFVSVQNYDFFVNYISIKYVIIYLLLILDVTLIVTQTKIDNNQNIAKRYYF
ncbi:hypothetical protein IC582_019941 [Cucumis melo]